MSKGTFSIKSRGMSIAVFKLFCDSSSLSYRNYKKISILLNECFSRFLQFNPKSYFLEMNSKVATCSTSSYILF